MAQETNRPPQKSGQGKSGRPAAQPSASGTPPYVAWAIVYAVVLVLFAPVLFVAGFFTNELVGDDDSGTAVVTQPTPTAGAPSPQPTTPTTPTPPPVVAVSVDDDPSIGPADAEVTIVEFSDYQ